MTLDHAHALALAALPLPLVRATFDALPAPLRARLTDAAGSHPDALLALRTHTAEAWVAQRWVARHERSARRCASADDPATQLLRALPQATKRRTQRALDRALPTDEDPALFPHTFGTRAQKRRGGTYTPSDLAELVLALTDPAPDARILEPSAGDGAFLIPAARRVSDPRRVLGVDAHPYACRALRTALALHDLPARVQCQDALLGDHPRDGAWDVVLGNPPFVRGERLPTDLRARYRDRYPDLGRGNVDLAAFFVRRALDWLTPGGRLGLILPQGLFEARATAGLRHLLRQHTPLAWISFEWAAPLFPGVQVIPCVLILQKSPPPPDHLVRLATPSAEHPLTPDALPWRELPHADWLRHTHTRWTPLLHHHDTPFLDTLAAAPTPLRASYGLAIRTRTTARSLIGAAHDRPNLTNPHPLLDGREVRPWYLEDNGRLLDYQPDLMSDPKTLDFFRAPKVLLPRIATAPQAAVDDGARGAYLVRNTVMVVRAPNTPLDHHPYALAALINSLPLRLYALLLLRAAALAGSHRATFYAASINAFPVPPDTLTPHHPLLHTLDTLGRDATRAAAARDWTTLDTLTHTLDTTVLHAFKLDPTHVLERAAAPPLDALLAAAHPNRSSRKIAVRDFAPGDRYR